MEVNLGNYNSLVRLNRISHGAKCYVRSSERCRRVFEELGLTPAEFLRPFGLMNKKIEFNSVNGKKKLITNYQVNFIDEKEYRVPTK